MASGLIIVQQYERLVVQRLGRFVNLQRPGLRFLIPVLYNGTRVDLREQVDRVPTQKYITLDNVVVDMDFVIYYSIMEDMAERSVLEVQNYRQADQPGLRHLEGGHRGHRIVRSPGRAGEDKGRGTGADG